MGANKTIKTLIVDDDKTVVSIVTKTLEQEIDQVNCITAFDGEEGLNLVKSEKPDVIILDINMPLKNGTEVLKDIRKIDEDYYQHVPVIMLTANKDMRTLTGAMSKGATLYMMKNAHDLQDLVSFVKSLTL